MDRVNRLQGQSQRAGTPAPASESFPPPPPPFTPGSTPDLPIKPPNPPNDLPPNLLAVYRRCLVTRPLTTKCVTSGAITMIAELISQRAAGQRMVLRRNTFAFAATGALFVAPYMDAWLTLLERLVPRGSPVPILRKLAWDRLVGAPPLLAINVFLIAILNGRGAGDALRQVRASLGGMLRSSLIFWTAVNFGNFSYVPPEFRLLVGNLAALVWNIHMALKMK